jgi:hypothetical protein
LGENGKCLLHFQTGKITARLKRGVRVRKNSIKRERKGPTNQLSEHL